MKIKSTLTLFALLTISFFLLNNSGGPASVQGQDRTGSPLSPGACNTAGCHDGGTFDPTVTIELLRNNVPVAGYEPGESHTLQVSITAGEGTPAGYGFQAVALNTNDENAGNFGFPSGGQQLVIFANNVEYMEHSTPSTNNTFSMSWTAPQMGAGDVTIYAAGNATNGDGMISGDGAMATSLTFTEGLILSTEDVGQLLDVSVFPNPAQEILNVKINSRASGSADLKISDVAGKTIHAEQFDILQGENVKQVDIGDLNNGMYFISLSSDSETITETIVKI